MADAEVLFATDELNRNLDDMDVYNNKDGGNDGLDVEQIVEDAGDAVMHVVSIFS